MRLAAPTSEARVLSDIPAVELAGLRFRYESAPDILHIPALVIGHQERLFLYGPSGCGKTTLLGLLAGVLRATAGSVRVLGRDLTTMSSSQRDAFRGSHMGYIFQLFNLITYLSVEDNIVLPCRLHGERRRRLGDVSLAAAAQAVAARLDIAPLLHQQVSKLSVGEQQRVAAARALIGAPEVILADEPTSSLDHDHRARFLELLFECAEEAGSTLIFVSHDRGLMPLFHRAVSLTEINRPHAS
jgi:putative ABC transport system ATP-binding protein